MNRRRNFFFIVLFMTTITSLLCYGASHTAAAQKQRKASKATRSRTTAPATKVARKAKSSKATSSKRADAQRWLPAIANRAEFNQISRTFMPDLLHPLPHVLFVIDLQDKHKVYYVNMKFYDLHEVFVNSMYLSLERGRTFWENNHLKPNRRFICGRVVYQSQVRRYVFEFWEGDTISAEQLALTSKVINRTFFASVAFKPNSPMQEQNSASVADMERVLPAELGKRPEYQPLNFGRGIGRLRLIKSVDEQTTVQSDEVLVLNETPISLPPVAGIVLSRMATPLSHVNLLARSWGVPNSFIDNAAAKLKSYDGKLVSYEVKANSYEIKLATPADLEAYQKQLSLRRASLRPRSDLATTELMPLRNQRTRLVHAYGAKSVNLGEVAGARIPGVIVPDGFTIPFFYYNQFMRENKLAPFIASMLRDEKFKSDPTHRREQLAQLRTLIRGGAVNKRLQREVMTQVKRTFGNKGVFVRSSSNAEDLPNFNGAGLYSTIPNVKGERAMRDAIKTVWASIWNFEAYETRERAGIDHTQVMMAVLIQEGINADSAGVMITTDPFNPENKNGIYINAKRGLGIRVVEGKRIAEQVIYYPQTDDVHVLTRSAEDSLLTFDAQGGVREAPITGSRVVLTDDLARRLAEAAKKVKQVFNNEEQDIEWVIMDDKVYIVQSRPYIMPQPGT